jgi:Tol biopolymer transport system component/DNA-binding winged helix-turn-helix (wHTH) protein
VPENTKEIRIYRFADMELNVPERLLLRGPEKIALTPRMFDLLLKLVEAEGHLLEKETLLNSVWADAIVEEGNLNRTISSLRKALGEVKGENRFIETVPKVGYRFVAPVSHTNGNSHRRVDASVDPAVPQTRTWPKWPLAVGAFLLLFGVLIGTYFFYGGSENNAARNETPNGPIRLTNNKFDEDAAVWGSDNRIRFIRFTGANQVASYVIDADGGNESRPVTPIKNLRTGGWSPNGKKVVFSKENESGLNSYLADSDGTNEIKLPFYPGSLAWAPDSSKFAYSTEFPAGSKNNEILIYDIDAKSSTVIASDPGFDANPSFSPDGKQLIFNSIRDGNAEIYLVNIDGSGLRRLTNHPAKEAFQVFSPDGTQIAFNSNRDNEKVSIFLMNVNDDSPPVRISGDDYDAEIRNGCWSPDGTRIVFTSNKDGANFNLYTQNVERFAAVKILADEKAELRFPAHSPDGNKLAFAAELADGKSEIRILDQTTKTVKSIHRSENADLQLAWSPDGKQLSFNCKSEGNTDICVIGSDGTDFQNLTNHAARDAGSAWSSDGSEIVFSSNREGGFEQYHLFRMNVDGSNQRRVFARSGYELSPALSPDGTHLYFAGDRADGRSSALDIFVLDIDHPENERIVASRRFHDTSPSVSPDGERIVFVAQSDGNEEIYIVNSDGSGILRLTRNPANDNNPRFSNDGARIIFSSNRDGRYELFELQL